MLVAQFQGRGFPSNVIRWVTRGPYSHSAFVFDDAAEFAAARLMNGNNWERLGRVTNFAAGSVIEAWLPVVRNVPSLAAGHPAGTIVDLFEFVEPLTDAEETQLIEFLGGEIGWPYDWKDVLRFVTRRPGDLDRSWFCSELVFAGLAEAGRLLFARTQAWEVPPSWIQRSPLLKFRETKVLS